MSFSSIRQTWYSRLICLCLMVAFISTMVVTPRVSYAQEGVLGLPQPGTMVNLSPAYEPLILAGLRVHPKDPLLMDFIVSTGDSNLNDDQIKKESDRLIKYFLACLTIPEKDQWVNLSPYEKQRIIPDDLGGTVLGQDMLAQDYLLKQLTASLIYPEKNLGKDFWEKIYAKARKEYGTSQIPVNTFNKVWILPQYAKVYEHKDTVLVVKSHLKVMLDEDYLALSKHEVSLRTTNNLSSNIVRQIVLPAIEQEVNNGKNFAQLRQIYNSMILAVWFKNNLKQAFLNQVYTDRAKVNGVNVDDPAIKEKIYQQYLQAYKKGVFNYIKEEPADVSLRGGGADEAISKGTTIARKYFSGGIVHPDIGMISPINYVDAWAVLKGGKFRLLHSQASGLPGINPAAVMEAMATGALRSQMHGDKLSWWQLKNALDNEIRPVSPHLIRVFYNNKAIPIGNGTVSDQTKRIIRVVASKTGYNPDSRFNLRADTYHGSVILHITDGAMTARIPAYVAVDIGGTKIEASVVTSDDNGNFTKVLFTRTMPTAEAKGAPAQFYDKVAEFVSAVQAEAKQNRGIKVYPFAGVGTPGRFVDDGHGGKMIAPGSAANLGNVANDFDGVDPTKELASRLPGTTVVVHNDAIAQMMFLYQNILQDSPAEAQRIRDQKLAFIAPGTGLGGGFRDTQVRTDGHIYDMKIVDAPVTLTVQWQGKPLEISLFGKAEDLFSGGNALTSIMLRINEAAASAGFERPFPDSEEWLKENGGKSLNTILEQADTASEKYEIAKQIAGFEGRMLALIIGHIYHGDIKKWDETADWPVSDSEWVQGTKNYLLGGSMMTGEFGGIVLQKAQEELKAAQIEDAHLIAPAIDTTLAGVLGAADFVAADVRRAISADTTVLNAQGVTDDIEYAQAVVKVAQEKYKMTSPPELLENLLMYGTENLDQASRDIVFTGRSTKDALALIVILRARADNFKTLTDANAWGLWEKAEAIYLAFLKSNKLIRPEDEQKRIPNARAELIALDSNAAYGTFFNSTFDSIRGEFFRPEFFNLVHSLVRENFKTSSAKEQGLLWNFILDNTTPKQLPEIAAAIGVENRTERWESLATLWALAHHAPAELILRQADASTEVVRNLASRLAAFIPQATWGSIQAREKRDILGDMEVKITTEIGEDTAKALLLLLRDERFKYIHPDGMISPYFVGLGDEFKGNPKLNAVTPAQFGRIEIFLKQAAYQLQLDVSVAEKLVTAKVLKRGNMNTYPISPDFDLSQLEHQLGTLIPGITETQKTQIMLILQRPEKRTVESFGLTGQPAKNDPVRLEIAPIALGKFAELRATFATLNAATKPGVDNADEKVKVLGAKPKLPPPASPNSKRLGVVHEVKEITHIGINGGPQGDENNEYNVAISAITEHSYGKTVEIGFITLQHKDRAKVQALVDRLNAIPGEKLNEELGEKRSPQDVVDLIRKKAEDLAINADDDQAHYDRALELQSTLTASINEASGPVGDKGFQLPQPPKVEAPTKTGEDGTEKDNGMIKGGIDLNSKNLNLESEGQKVNMAFDAAMVAQFRRGDFSGVKIQILDVSPISLVPLLG